MAERDWFEDQNEEILRSISEYLAWRDRAMTEGRFPGPVHRPTARVPAESSKVSADSVAVSNTALSR